MNVEWVIREAVVSNEVQERISKKLSKILERSHKETSVRIQVGNVKNAFSTTISMSVTGKDLVAHVENESMVSALDEAVDRVERQFKKHIDKLSQHR